MKTFKLLLLLLLLNTSLIGQVLNQYGNPIIRNYTPEENGGSEQNWSTIQDNRGVMYFGNQDKGILEYDGKTWRQIPIPNNSIVRSLAKDDEGTIYVGAVGDFGYLEPDIQGAMKFVSLNTYNKDSIKISNVYKTYCFKGKIYFCSSRYIIIYDKKKTKLIDTEKNVSGKNFLSFFVNNHLYIGSFLKGLRELVNDSLINAPNSTFFEKKDIFFILPSENDNAIVGTGVDFYNYNQKTGEVSVFSDKRNLIGRILKESWSYHAIVQANGNLSFAFPLSADYSYLEVDRNRLPLEVINRSIGLKDGSVSFLYRSPENSSENPIWLTHFYGLSRADIQSPFRKYGEESGLNGLIQDIIRFNGTLYVGTMKGLFKQIVENGFIKFIPETITSSVWSFEIFSNPENGQISLLIASDDGIFEVNKSGRVNSISEKFKDQISIVGYKVYQSKINPSRLYIGEKAGISAFDNIKGEWIYRGRFFENELRTIVRSIGEDSIGNLWLGTNFDGVVKLSDNNKKYSFYKTESGLPNINEIQIFSNSKSLYFGTSKGLYNYNSKSNKFSPSSLLGGSSTPSDYGISKMVKTKNGFVLACNNKSSNWILLAESDSTKKYSLIDTPFKRLPEKASDAIYDDNGIIWISCAKELYSYNPNTKRNYQLPYNALVRKVKVLSKEDTVLFNGASYYKDGLNKNIVSLIQSPEQIHKLPYRLNRLVFEFSATFYEKEEETQFIYLLEGSDETWSLWNKEAKATYTNLREGNYTFKVKARNIYGTESNIAEYKFSIAPPWYRTILAWILYSILFIVLIWILVRWNTRRLIAEKEELEEIVKERTAEVVAQKDEIEAQSEMISIQNEEIKSSIHYASRIQGAILTPNEQIEKIFNEFFILFLPRDIVSGDFYWVTKVGTKKICVVADCTGHGVPGGFMSMLGMSFISQIISKG